VPTTPDICRTAARRGFSAKDMTMTRLTLKRLRAIEEALIFRLAGEIEAHDDAIPAEDYDAALDWVIEEIARREYRR
jgi:hypothetical protein